jgi:DNA-binding helix-hairpin-helix protein with protein kinase domain
MIVFSGDNNRFSLSLTSPAAHSGGEGEIRLIPSRPGFAAKIFRRPDRQRRDKLKAMLTGLPSTTTTYAFAAPEQLLYAGPRSEDCIGYVMRYYPKLTPLFAIVRQLRGGHLSVNDGLQIACNIAEAFAACHYSEIVIGDCNDANMLIAVGNQATNGTHAATKHQVVFVDCDSFQIKTRSQMFRCTVGRPEFTPPELQGVGFASVDRQPSSDNFGLAVVIFELLMRGHHAFAAGYRGPGNAPPLATRIKRGLFPHSSRSLRDFPPKASAPPFVALPPELQHFFREAFETGHRDPSLRPTAQRWRDALVRVTSAELKSLAMHSLGGRFQLRSKLEEFNLQLRRMWAIILRHPRTMVLGLGLPLVIAGLYQAASPAGNEPSRTRADDREIAAPQSTPWLWRELRRHIHQ